MSSTITTRGPHLAGDPAVIVARRFEDVVVGNEISRHNLLSRLSHWAVAVSFAVAMLSGMHLVVRLARGIDDRAAAARAAHRDVWAMPLSSCYLGRAERRGFVLGFGGTSRAEISRGVRGLRAALAR